MEQKKMRILLYNPDNGVTRNFMPHLWMFLLQALTPSGHEVLLIDGNAQPMDEEGIARYVREQNIDLVGIGAMTRMIAKAYRMLTPFARLAFEWLWAARTLPKNLTRRWGATAVNATRTPSLSAKPMKPGRRLWKTPRVAR